MIEYVEPICCAIASFRADCGGDVSPMSILDTWFYTKQADIRGSFYVHGHAIDLFPDLEYLQKNLKKRHKHWIKDEEARLSLRSYPPTPYLEVMLERAIEEHKLIRIDPERLSAESLLNDISPKSRPCPAFSYQFLATASVITPPGLLWVACQFCIAWATHLKGRRFFYESDKFSSVADRLRVMGRGSTLPLFPTANPPCLIESCPPFSDLHLSSQSS